jgi:hypothetical protein
MYHGSGVATLEQNWVQRNATSSSVIWWHQGLDATTAIKEVRKNRPRSLETKAQENVVKGE